MTCHSVPNLGTTLACQVSQHRINPAYKLSGLDDLLELLWSSMWACSQRHTGRLNQKSTTLGWDQLVDSGVLVILSKSKVWLIRWQHFVCHKVKPKQSCETGRWEGLFRSLIQLLPFIWAAWRRDFNFKPLGAFFCFTQGYCPEAH